MKTIQSVVISLLGTVLALTSVGHAETAVNQLTDSEQRAGWQLLFDGKSMDGWRNYQKDEISDGWQIQDGAITRTADGAGDIITKDQYEHFELVLEYRISKGGNSGVMFHVTEDSDQPYHTGPEVQIQDNIDGRDPQKSGWLYQLYRSKNPDWQYKYQKAMNRSATQDVDTTRPAGKWNHLYLHVADLGEVVVNGSHYFYFQKGSDEWEKRVAGSKFAR